jgi:F0F1-type ATP synthase epsilon subunit
VARAQQAKLRAEETLRSQAPDTKYDEEQGALKRAETRIEVAEKGGR